MGLCRVIANECCGRHRLCGRTGLFLCCMELTNLLLSSSWSQTYHTLSFLCSTVAQCANLTVQEQFLVPQGLLYFVGVGLILMNSLRHSAVTSKQSNILGGRTSPALLYLWAKRKERKERTLRSMMRLSWQLLMSLRTETHSWRENSCIGH